MEQPPGGDTISGPAGASIWAERAAHALADAGYRPGGARGAILELLDEQTSALSALEIQRVLSDRRREVSRASVYRVMEELEAVGVLQRVEVGQGIVRFEPARVGLRLRLRLLLRPARLSMSRVVDRARSGRDRDQSPARLVGSGWPCGGGSSSISWGIVTR